MTLMINKMPSAENKKPEGKEKEMIEQITLIWERYTQT